MNDIAAPHRLCRHRLLIAAVFATTVLVLAGCGGSSSNRSRSPNTGGASSRPSAVGYSACIRAHGVRRFPDPSSDGTIPKGTAQQFGVSDSRYQTAQTSCEHLLPNTGEPSPAVIQQAMSGMRSFAQCMRAHGLADWPDPTTDRAGYPAFYLQGKFDDSSPQIVTQIHTCQHLVPETQVGGGPAGVPMCPGDRPGLGATSTCGGPHQDG